MERACPNMLSKDLPLTISLVETKLITWIWFLLLKIIDRDYNDHMNKNLLHNIIGGSFINHMNVVQFTLTSLTRIALIT